jgi:trimethylamine--corrinoid protein Co-methyltransferase
LEEVGMLPRFSLLSQEEVQAIHAASLQLLEKTGVTFDSAEALTILGDHGAWIDKAKRRAKIPGHMVAEAVAKCAPEVTLYGRDGAPDLRVGGWRVYFGTVGYGTFALDWKTGQYRQAKYADLVEMVHLAEALENVDFLLPPVCPQDCPPDKLDLYEFKGCLLHSRKPSIPEAYRREHVQTMVDMAAAVVGGYQALREKPIFSIIFVITSPLTIRQDIAETIIDCARLMVPIYMGAGPQGGGNSPCTIAGTLALANAEALAGTVLAKLVNPAVPVVYASWARHLDLRAANVAFGAPEFGMARVGAAQMARFYGMPSGGGGLIGNSKVLDVQQGWEKMATALLPALAGLNMILGQGLIASENTISLEQLVADDEMAGYVKRLLGGISVDDDRLAVAEVHREGPGGAFITTPHTFKYFKTEYWAGKVSDRYQFNVNESPEPKAMASRIRRRIEERLAAYRPLEDHLAQEKVIDDIIGR